jgi:hypothetical protein
MIEENVRRKLTDLVGRAHALADSSSGVARNSRHISLCDGWITEALNIIELAVPLPSNAYRRRVEKLGESSGHTRVQRVGSIAEILSALLSDIDAGLLTNISNKVRAETFDDFLDHAEWYRGENRKQEAGTIAGVVFEDTIRRIYRDKIGNDKGKSVEDLINDLARQDVITGQQSKQAKVGSHVRTKATHAQWDEFDLAGVTATIVITRLLLREHLGG